MPAVTPLAIVFWNFEVYDYDRDGLVYQVRGEGIPMDDMMKLTKWERGIKVESRFDPNQFAFLWFYEWHLFDAIRKGEHTPGAFDWRWGVDENGTTAQMDARWLKMNINATEKGADLSLEIGNNTKHDWPAIAAIIPCFNPGNPLNKPERNALFLDEDYIHTYFQGKNGLEVIKGAFSREIHFNHECRSAVMSWDKEREDGSFVFDEKWPTSERDAYAGVMIRESEDKRYVIGIAWESFLSAQGHNPWNCMHLSIKVGPLARGEKKTIRGKIYVFESSKEDCLQEFEKDFGQSRSTKRA